MFSVKRVMTVSFIDFSLSKGPQNMLELHYSRFYLQQKLFTPFILRKKQGEMYNSNYYPTQFPLLPSLLSFFGAMFPKSLWPQ